MKHVFVAMIGALFLLASVIMLRGNPVVGSISFVVAIFLEGFAIDILLHGQKEQVHSQANGSKVPTKSNEHEILPLLKDDVWHSPERPVSEHESAPREHN